jgi:hypothetical protein
MYISLTSRYEFAIDYPYVKTREQRSSTGILFAVDNAAIAQKGVDSWTRHSSNYLLGPATNR